MSQLKNNARTISNHIIRVEHLIKQGLGYCCPWLFFHLNRRASASLIATRFGVAEGTIKTWRRKFKDDELKCESCTNCMKSRAKRRK